jgi:hypothetical protein
MWDDAATPTVIGVNEASPFRPCLVVDSSTMVVPSRSIRMATAVQWAARLFQTMSAAHV